MVGRKNPSADHNPAMPMTSQRLLRALLAFTFAARSASADNATAPAPVPVPSNDTWDMPWKIALAVSSGGLCILGCIAVLIVRKNEKHRTTSQHSTLISSLRPRDAAGAPSSSPPARERALEQQLAAERRTLHALQNRVETLEQWNAAGLTLPHNRDTQPQGILRHASVISTDVAAAPYRPPQVAGVQQLQQQQQQQLQQQQQQQQQLTGEQPQPYVFLSPPDRKQQAAPPRRLQANLAPLCRPVEFIGDGDSATNLTVSEVQMEFSVDAATAVTHHLPADVGSPMKSAAVVSIDADTADQAEASYLSVMLATTGATSKTSVGSQCARGAGPTTSDAAAGTDDPDADVATSYAESFHSTPPQRTLVMPPLPLPLPLPPPLTHTGGVKPATATTTPAHVVSGGVGGGGADFLATETPGSSSWSPGHLSHPSTYTALNLILPVFDESKSVARQSVGSPPPPPPPQLDKSVLRAQHGLLEKEKQLLQARLNEMASVLAAAPGGPHYPPPAQTPRDDDFDPSTPIARPVFSRTTPVDYGDQALSLPSPHPLLPFSDLPPTRSPSYPLTHHTPKYGTDRFGRPTPLE